MTRRDITEIGPVKPFVFYSWFDMTSGTTAERQTQTVNLIRQFYAFILNSVSDVIFFLSAKFGNFGFCACESCSGKCQFLKRKSEAVTNGALTRQLRHRFSQHHLITVCTDRLFQMNVRYESVTGRGYTVTCLFAGIYIADVSFCLI